MKSGHVGIQGLLFAIALSADTAWACGLKDLRAFEEKAQSANPEAESFGKSLLDCPTEKREAFQWLAFLSAMKATKEIPKLPSSIGKEFNTNSRRDPKLGQGLSIEQEIEAAYSGSFKRLREEIDGGNPTFFNSFDAQLAVGRALVRQGLFADGRQYYDNALRIGSHDSRFDVERLYTYIWERNLILAEREFGRISQDNSSAELMAGVNRGQALIASLKGLPGPGASDKNQIFGKKATFGSQIEAFYITNEFRRYTGSVQYTGIVDALFAHHLMAQDVYEKSTIQRDVFWIGKDNWSHGPFHLGGKIGFRSNAVTNRFLFLAHLGLDIKDYISVKLGTDRNNIFENMPLPTDSLDLVQDRVFASLQFGNDWIFQSAVLRDSGREAFVRNSINLDSPLSLFSKSSVKVFGLAGAEYESRARPSPDYETYRQGLRTHIGTRVVNQAASDLQLTGGVRYFNIQRQGHGMDLWIQNSGISAKIQAIQKMDRDWRLVGSAEYNGEETLRSTQLFQNRVNLRFGAEFIN